MKAISICLLFLASLNAISSEMKPTKDAMGILYKASMKTGACAVIAGLRKKAIKENNPNVSQFITEFVTQAFPLTRTPEEWSKFCDDNAYIVNFTINEFKLD